MTRPKGKKRNPGLLDVNPKLIVSDHFDIDWIRGADVAKIWKCKATKRLLHLVRYFGKQEPPAIEFLISNKFFRSMFFKKFLMTGKNRSKDLKLGENILLYFIPALEEPDEPFNDMTIQETKWSFYMIEEKG